MPEDREPLAIEPNPDPAFIQFLDDQLYAFNVETSGVRDDELLAIVLRDSDGKPVGGAYGWSWGGTCYLRHLLIPRTCAARASAPGSCRPSSRRRCPAAACRCSWRDPRLPGAGLLPQARLRHRRHGQ